jgi:hypothetical protein
LVVREDAVGPAVTADEDKGVGSLQRRVETGPIGIVDDGCRG